MTRKTIKNKPQYVTNRTYLWGNLNSTSVTKLADQVVADATWSRPLPAMRPLPHTYMDVEEYAENPTVYDATYQSKFGTEGKIGYLFHAYGSWPTFVEQTFDDGSDAWNRALSKITNGRGTFGETLVEANKTAELLHKRGSQLYRAALALKKRDVKAIERALKQSIPRDSAGNIKLMPASRLLSDGYLEILFAVMPLIQNIEDASRIYAEGLREKGDSVRFVSRPPRKDSWDSSSQGPARGSATLVGRVTNPTAANLNELGLLNIPREVWNMLPLSFVFDWGGNVGSFLGALTGSAGMSLYGSRTEVTQRLIISTHAGEIYSRRKDILRMPQFGTPTRLPTSLGREAHLTFGKVVTLFALGRSMFFSK